MRTVFVGQACQAAGGVVVVVEGVSERVGTLQRQAVRAVFVAGGVPCGIGVAHEAAGVVVGEGFIAAVGVTGRHRPQCGVVMVFGAAAFGIGDAQRQAVFVVFEAGFVTGAVGYGFGQVVRAVAVGNGMSLGVGHGFEQAVAEIAETGDAADGIGVADQVAGVVVAVVVGIALGVGSDDEPVVVVVFAVEGDAVGAGDVGELAFAAVLIVGGTAERVGISGQAAEAVAFHRGFGAVGKGAAGQFVVAVETVALGAAEYVGHVGMAVVIVEAPLPAVGYGVEQYPPFGIVAVVLVGRDQSGCVGMGQHDVVAVGKGTGQVAVAAEHAQQVAGGGIFVAHQYPAARRRRTEGRQSVKQRHRGQPHHRFGDGGDVAELQVEHPAVAINDKLRQTGGGMVQPTLTVAVAVFDCGQNEQRAVRPFRVVVGHRSRHEAQREGAVECGDEIMRAVAGEPEHFGLIEHWSPVVEVRQRQASSLFVDVGHPIGRAYDASASGYAPTVAEPTGAGLVGEVAAVPNEGEDAGEGEIGFVGQYLDAEDGVDGHAGEDGSLTCGAFFFESAFVLVVHMEHVAGSDDVVVADFDGGGMGERPCGFAGGMGEDAFFAQAAGGDFGVGGFVAESFWGVAGVEDEGGFFVDEDVAGDGFGLAEVGGEGEGDGRGLRRGRRSGEEAEVWEDADDAEGGVFAGGFLKGHL